MSEFSIFDGRPITLGRFTLTARGIKVTGAPTFDEWQNAMEFAAHTAHSSIYWLGALWNYAESRDDWRDRISQALETTGHAKQTLLNAAYVVRQVSEDLRRKAPTPGHAAEVAPLPPEEQEHWIERAATEGWTVRDLRMNIRAARRARVIEGQAELAGKYRVIYADPPWQYSDSGVIKGSAYGKAEAHYEGMTMEDIARLPVAAHTLPNAVLFLWVTSPVLMQNPGPREVIDAWGFDYKSSFVWDKVLGNFGHYNHVVHEFLLVCTRGSCLPDVPTPQPKSVIYKRRSDMHSEKPEEVRQMIMRHWTHGPYLELFGRAPVEGWTVWGNDARLWPMETEAAV